MQTQEFIEGDFEEQEMQSTSLIAADSQALIAAPVEAIEALNPKDFEELLMPSLSLATIQNRMALIHQLVTTAFVRGKHYGQIPGTQGDTLLLLGAEWFAAFFGLSIRMSTEDKEIVRKPGEQFVMFSYKASIYKGATLLSECVGICHTDEDCFKVWVACQPPETKEQQQEMIASKQAKWTDDNKWIEKRPNPNPIGQMNNVSKRAQKRGMVGGIEKATGASQYFSKGVLNNYDWKNPPKTGGTKPVSDRGDFARKSQENNVKNVRTGEPVGAEKKAEPPPSLTEQNYDGSTRFWLAVDAAGIKRADAKQEADKAAAGEITWQQAIDNLPK